MNRILVYDGPNDKSMLIGELFGTTSNKSISSSGKSMFIDFRKQASLNSATINAFVASIEYKKINSTCQSWLDLDNNVIMSPIHSHINCHWLITRKFGYYITLQFSYIEVKPMLL